MADGAWRRPDGTASALSGLTSISWPSTHLSGTRPTTVLLERVLGAIGRHAPTVPEEFEKDKREVEQREREIEEKRQHRREKVKRHTLAEVVDQVLQPGRLDRHRPLASVVTFVLLRRSSSIPKRGWRLGHLGREPPETGS